MTINHLVSYNTEQKGHWPVVEGPTNPHMKKDKYEGEGVMKSFGLENLCRLGPIEKSTNQLHLNHV